MKQKTFAETKLRSIANDLARQAGTTSIANGEMRPLSNAAAVASAGVVTKLADAVSGIDFALNALTAWPTPLPPDATRKLQTCRNELGSACVAVAAAIKGAA